FGLSPDIVDITPTLDIFNIFSISSITFCLSIAITSVKSFPRFYVGQTFNGASFGDRNSAGSLTEPRLEIEAPLEVYRSLVWESKLCWKSNGASFGNRSSAGSLTEPRLQIEAPMEVNGSPPCSSTTASLLTERRVGREEETR